MRALNERAWRARRVLTGRPRVPRMAVGPHRPAHCRPAHRHPAHCCSHGLIDRPPLPRWRPICLSVPRARVLSVGEAAPRSCPSRRPLWQSRPAPPPPTAARPCLPRRPGCGSAQSPPATAAPTRSADRRSPRAVDDRQALFAALRRTADPRNVGALVQFFLFLNYHRI